MWLRRPLSPEAWELPIPRWLPHLLDYLSSTPTDIPGRSPSSWRRYCHDAASDLERAAEEESVSDALKQQKDQYAADTKSDSTEGSTGRAAAAKMLMQACQALSAGKKPASISARILDKPTAAISSG
jgi:hypothetical protein